MEYSEEGAYVLEYATTAGGTPTLVQREVSPPTHTLESGAASPLITPHGARVGHPSAVTPDARLRTVTGELTSQLSGVAGLTASVTKSMLKGTKSEDRLRKTARNFIAKESVTDTTEYQLRLMEATMEKKAVADSFAVIELRLRAVQGSEKRLHEASKLLFSVWHIVASGNDK